MLQYFPWELEGFLAVYTSEVHVCCRSQIKKRFDPSCGELLQSMCMPIFQLYSHERDLL